MTGYCEPCRTGDCWGCVMRDNPTVDCVCDCPWAWRLYPVPDLSIEEALMPDIADDDPDYTTDVKADAADHTPLPTTADLKAIPADEGDCGDGK